MRNPRASGNVEGSIDVDDFAGGVAWLTQWLPNRALQICNRGKYRLVDNNRGVSQVQREKAMPDTNRSPSDSPHILMVLSPELLHLSVSVWFKGNLKLGPPSLGDGHIHLKSPNTLAISTKARVFTNGIREFPSKQKMETPRSTFALSAAVEQHARNSWNINIIYSILRKRMKKILSLYAARHVKDGKK
ncbi:hypothetical protein K438DRAFT_1766710 [Mycena galopus ATCC 62051]|nr:hypothetical protein K438DRAFT_1766710 [Mycena galopus ATCC 62051]